MTRPRLCPPKLTQGYEDGWPISTPIGMFLDAVRTGNGIVTAALISGLDPEHVTSWKTRGTHWLAEKHGEVAQVKTTRRPMAAFVVALARAEADAQSTLTAVIMEAAVADHRDSWRAAAWLLNRNVPVSRPATPEIEEDDDDDDELDLSAAVFESEDEE